MAETDKHGWRILHNFPAEGQITLEPMEVIDEEGVRLIALALVPECEVETVENPDGTFTHTLRRK